MRNCGEFEAVIVLAIATGLLVTSFAIGAVVGFVVAVTRVLQ